MFVNRRKSFDTLLVKINERRKVCDSFVGQSGNCCVGGQFYVGAGLDPSFKSGGDDWGYDEVKEFF